jgi:hypothetical protein
MEDIDRLVNKEIRSCVVVILINIEKEVKPGVYSS